MKIEYHNLYTHFILITKNRTPSILQNNRERIEKYITGIINNNNSKLYSIYANPEHTCLPAGRYIFLPPVLQECWKKYWQLLLPIAPPNSSMKINLVWEYLNGRNRLLPFPFQNQMSIRFANTSLTNQIIIKK